MAGRTVAHYRIVEKIGAGGMGVVYRAQDTKLAREVAIKVLPEVFAQDPERLERFQREAQLLASLDHPNIAAIHGLEESGDLHYLVLELVPGGTLAEQLALGPMDVAASLRICVQIAEALEAAHQNGVIHRDIKPANIKVTPENKVKVLDFGLAKAFASEGLSPDFSTLSRVAATATQEGVIRGTPSYMSPEQARGKTVDKRTDIWAFGCVMYELLTGRRAFPGQTISDTIAGILNEVPDWRALPEATPAGIRCLLRRCLEKDSRRRLHDIGDARIEIEDAIASPLPVAGKKTTWTTLRDHPIRLSLAVMMVCALAISFFVWKLQPTSLPSHGPVMRFTVTLPSTERLTGMDFPSIAISPAGSHLAYVASRGGTSQLFLRRMDSLQSEPISGTEQALGPFFSPDGHWIGFFAGGKLMKVSIQGGAPASLCYAPIGFGAVWGRDDTITFAPTGGSGLLQVPSGGGTPRAVTRLNSEKGEISHRWPDLLPDGKTVLFTVGALGSWDDAQIVAQSLQTGERHILIVGGTSPHYVPTGNLIYVRGGTLLAVPFDVAQSKVTGPPVAVLPRVWESVDGAAQLSTSPLGHLVYVPGGPPGSMHTLVWVSRKNDVEPLAAPPDAYSDPRLAPDGRRLAVTITRTSENVWIYDIPTGNFTQLTFDGNNSMPVWMPPDGARLAFASNRTGPLNLFWRRTDEGGSDERLTTSELLQVPCSWLPGGRGLVFVENSPTTGRDIRMLSMDGDLSIRPVLQSPSNETGPALSPDGRWLAYVSDESGRNEVYVSSFPGAQGKWQVSVDGGTEPLWSHDGSEIFYRIGNHLMAARITTTPSFKRNTPQSLFEGAYDRGKASRPAYDVSADGARFLFVRSGDKESAPIELEVILEWFQELKHRVSR